MSNETLEVEKAEHSSPRRKSCTVVLEYIYFRFAEIYGKSIPLKVLADILSPKPRCATPREH